MPLSGQLLADFSSFQKATQDALVNLRGFETGANKVGTALNRMVDQFSGRKLIQDAQLMTQAVERTGGIAKLTGNQLQRMGAQAAEAIEKMTKMGIAVPPGLQKIATAATDADAKIKAMAAAAGPVPSTFSKIVSAAGPLGAALTAAFSVQSLIGFGSKIIAVASEIHDSALKIGISGEAYQRFQHVAKQTGADISLVATTMLKMNQILAGGETGTVAALKAAGLEFHAIRAMRPEAAFVAIMTAAKDIPDLMLQTQVVTQLLGKSAVDWLPAIREGFVDIAKLAEVMNDKTTTDLEAAGQAWENFGNTVTIVSANVMGSVAGMVKETVGSWKQLFDILGTAILHGPGAAATAANLASILRDTQATKDISLPRDLHAKPPRTKDEEAAIKKAAKDALDAAKEAERVAATESKLATGYTTTYIRTIDQRLTKDKEWRQAQNVLGLQQMEAERARLAKIAGDYRGFLNTLGERDIERAAAHLALTERTAKQERDLWNWLGEQRMAADRAVLDAEIANAGQLRAMWNDIGVKQMEADAARIATTTTTWSDALHDVASAFDVVGDKWSSLAQGILENTAAIVTMWEGARDAAGNIIIDPTTGKGKGANRMAAVGMALGVAAEYVPDDTTAGAVTKGAMQGAAAGAPYAAFTGGMSMVVGAGVGALVGWYKSGKAARQVNDVRDAFVAQAGGLALLNDKAYAAGATLTAMLDADTPKEYEAAIQNLTNAIDFQDQSMQFVTDTMSKYGLSVADMGTAWAQQDLDKQASLLNQEFRALEAAGANVETISTAMGESLNTYFQHAVETGATVPESMREILHQLVEMGALYDENGVAVENLEASGVTFAETLTDQFGTLLTTIEKLVEAIDRGLGGAIANLPSLPDLGGGMPADVIPMAAGGFGRVTRPTLFLAGESGAEDVAFSGGGLRFPKASGGGTTVVHSHLYLDGREVAEAVERVQSANLQARQKQRAA